MMSVWFPQKQILRERFECKLFIEIKETLWGECGCETGKAANKSGLSSQLSPWTTRAHSFPLRSSGRLCGTCLKQPAGGVREQTCVDTN